MDTLKYSGKVKITVYKNGKKIGKSTTHNTGALPLFRFFADCLCSAYDERNAPAYMRVDSGTSEVTLPAAPLTQRNPQLINGYPTAMLQSTLKYSNTSLGKINTVQLLNSGKEVMATVEVEPGVILNSAEYSAVIQWYLRVDNAGESDNVSNLIRVMEDLGYTVTKK